MTIYQKQCLLSFIAIRDRDPDLSPGAIDGQDGPHTQAALAQFTAMYGFGEDGLIGAVAGNIERKKVEVHTVENGDNAAADAAKYLHEDGYYHIPKGLNIRLSEHFTSAEYDCHGTNCCTETIINPQLVKDEEALRKRMNAPITNTSAYRCPRHNGSVGGATGSRHCKGDAADIVVSGHTPRTIAMDAENMGIKGIGLYETSADGFFVHIDERPTKSYWYGQSQQYRSTFK